MKKPRSGKSITTKKGDKGKTSLFDGSRVSKSSLRPETYGTLDEACAFIGLARAKSGIEELGEVLFKLQSLIYLVNAELACPPESKGSLHKRFEADHLEWTEEKAKEIEKRLNLPPKFVVYGETETGAILDVARAVVRRTERLLILLDEAETLENPHVKPFVNRLSDLLYLLARWEDHAAGKSPRHPEC
ncbi:MAG: cob(I)yrinic acid a,c-diamide adenosyltransferase [Planctomycetota bacterium]|jgi:cob(I)alamin adenosyltransferase